MNRLNFLDRKLRVGVTLHIRDENQSIWENGIFQNCAFLVQTLRASPAVEQVVLVLNRHDDVSLPPRLMFDSEPQGVMNMTQAMNALDVVIEMSAQLSEDWIRAFAARGGRVVGMRVGNDYVIDIERAMHAKPAASLWSSKAYDAIWTIPEYERSCVDYYALMARAPVRVLPHLWSPEFFQKGFASLPPGVAYGYQPGRTKWRLCSFEPNVCMVKTSTIPLLICEQAYRQEPQCVDVVRMCNTLHLKEHPAFLGFATRLDLVRHGVASFDGRFAMYEFMAHFGDCIVSHHWENGQNYIYYEALYGGYPLIHNSEFIRDYGYFYPDFDIHEGATALRRAIHSHDQGLADYRRKADEFIDTLSPVNAANVQAYSDELLRLFA